MHARQDSQARRPELVICPRRRDPPAPDHRPRRQRPPAVKRP